MAATPDDLERFASIRTIDFTTFGRKSGKPRRIEIWWFHVNGRFIITGTPGQRDWLANVRANPTVVVHVDGRDIETTATVIEDRNHRLEVFSQPETRWYSTQGRTRPPNRRSSDDRDRPVATVLPRADFPPACGEVGPCAPPASGASGCSPRDEVDWGNRFLRPTK